MRGTDGEPASVRVCALRAVAYFCPSFERQAVWEPSLLRAFWSPFWLEDRTCDFSSASSRAQWFSTRGSRMDGFQSMPFASYSCSPQGHFLGQADSSSMAGGVMSQPGGPMPMVNYPHYPGNVHQWQPSSGNYPQYPGNVDPCPQNPWQTLPQMPQQPMSFCLGPPSTLQFGPHSAPWTPSGPPLAAPLPPPPPTRPPTGLPHDFHAPPPPPEFDPEEGDPGGSSGNMSPRTCAGSEGSEKTRAEWEQQHCPPTQEQKVNSNEGSSSSSGAPSKASESDADEVQQLRRKVSSLEQQVYVLEAAAEKTSVAEEAALERARPLESAAAP